MDEKIINAEMQNLFEDFKKFSENKNGIWINGNQLQVEFLFYKIAELQVLIKNKS